ncbi:MAG: primosomal protein N' [Myxococcota bacterium]
MDDPLFAPTDIRVARVALPVPIDAIFDYRVPDGLAARAVPGCRARVRFRERQLTGVIVECAQDSRFRDRLVSLEGLVDSEPVLSASMLGILRDAAAEILCPIGIALAAALPPGSAPRRIPEFALTARGREALRSGVPKGKAFEVLEALSIRPRAASALRRQLPSVDLGALERDGLVCSRVREGSPPGREPSIRMLALAPHVDLDTALSDLARAPRQAALLGRLARDGPMPIASLKAEFPQISSLQRALTARGLISSTQHTQRREPESSLPPGSEVVLTSDQADALKPIAAAVRESNPETFLLHGVTGSGKTEIYLRAVGEALQKDRQALVLVPEITLTHQIVARLRGRFGDRVAILHSGLRPGQRLAQWQRLRSGSTPIAVGARSALFAPLENLGVIVIDEEHDSAYKNEEGFRYHAHQLAAHRANQARCPVILGSATPCLETRFAADRGQLRRLVLPRRIGGRPLPAVTIVDMARARERARRGERIILSAELRRAMAETLGQGGQTILFLNRRGFSTQILCFACGFTERCSECDIALVYHTPEQKLRCHYCDRTMPPPEVCAQCGAPDVALLGLGTQRVEEEVRIHFPGARVARLDGDTARRRGYVEGVLNDLQNRRLDVVVGTQIVAKGHDFPGVRLVGVVLADTGLHFPDFRAAERTFQLLTQVAGRAGRDAAPGRVIVQSFIPSHYAIRPVVDHDFERFYLEELGHRASIGYPPFGHLVHALVSGPDEAAARAGADELAKSLADIDAPGIERLGPAPAPLARLRGRHRFQLLVKGADKAAVRCAAEAMMRAARRLPSGIQASVDTHPVNML